MQTDWVQPPVLQGDGVRLEPMRLDHADGLLACGGDNSDWRFMPRAGFTDRADAVKWIEDARNAASQQPFVIVRCEDDRIVGSTRYLAIRPEHRSLEIGWTWLCRDTQGTGINGRAKMALLSHAFEELSCVRVEFKTDARNLRSQAALEKIGATREGVLRQHMIVQEGHLRDSVYFSILHSEWPRVKAALAGLARGP